MLQVLVTAWDATPQPAVLFNQHIARRSTLTKTLIVSVISSTLGVTFFAVAINNLFTSGPITVFSALAIPLGLVYLILIWLIGGFIIMNTAYIGLVAWEIVALAWIPIGFIALLFSPLAWLMPAPGILFFGIALSIWHLVIIHGAIKTLSPTKTRPTFLLYLGTVFFLPTSLFALFITLFNAS